MRRRRAQVAYLAPERVEMPPAVRQVLRDAHARLGGTACGAKQVACSSPGGWRGGHVTLTLDREGEMRDDDGTVMQPHSIAVGMNDLLRRARVSGTPLHMACCDEEAVLRAGLEPTSESAALVEARVWQLERLAWEQQEQRRWREERAVVRWERRGGAGRRGRRRREPGVVFELGPWGEERRALPHWEAARVLVQAMEG